MNSLYYKRYFTALKFLYYNDWFRLIVIKQYIISSQTLFNASIL